MIGGSPRGRRPYRGIRHRLAALACVIPCLSLASCAPSGKAVGDTQEREPDVAHIGEIRSDVLVGLIGAKHADADLDGEVLDALGDAQLEAVYVATTATVDPDAAARQGVDDLIGRRASIIVISGLDAKENAESWSEALGDARKAGIPVALLDPVSTPDDDILFAATLASNDADAADDLDDAGDASPVADAIMDIIDDHPHGRTITVTTRGS